MPITSNLDHHSGEWTPEPESPAYIRDHGLKAQLTKAGGEFIPMTGAELEEFRRAVRYYRVMYNTTPPEERKPGKLHWKSSRNCSVLRGYITVLPGTEISKADRQQFHATLSANSDKCCRTCIKDYMDSLRSSYAA